MGHINDVCIIQKVPWYSFLTNKPVDHFVENCHLFIVSDVVPVCDTRFTTTYSDVRMMDVILLQIPVT